VHEIADLSRSEIAPAEFYDAMLNKVVAALAAPGGAVWTLSDTGGILSGSSNTDGCCGRC
jgi:hypothetical protein